MDSKKIDQLLEKYWECQTSLEEESTLKEYFNAGVIEEKHKEVAPLFQYYTIEKKEGQLSGMFDEQVLAAIEKEGMPIKKKGKVISFFSDIAKVAAVGLILITAGYFIKEEVEKENTQPLLSDTFEDPQKAFEETKKALKLISDNFNKGRKQAKKISTFNQAQDKIKENNL